MGWYLHSPRKFRTTGRVGSSLPDPQFPEPGLETLLCRPASLREQDTIPRISRGRAARRRLCLQDGSKRRIVVFSCLAAFREAKNAPCHFLVTWWRRQDPDASSGWFMRPESRQAASGPVPLPCHAGTPGQVLRTGSLRIPRTIDTQVWQRAVNWRTGRKRMRL